MKKSRSLTVEQLVRVSVMSEDGFSTMQIASRVNCSPIMVVKIIQKKKLTGSVVDRDRSGRPRASTSRQDRTLRRMSLTNRKLTSPQPLRQWTGMCNVVACSSTAHRRRLECGLKGCKTRRKPLMTGHERRNRICSAGRYANWTCKMCEKMLFGDESTFAPLATRPTPMCGLCLERSSSQSV